MNVYVHRIIKVDLLLSTELIEIIPNALLVTLPCVAALLDERAGLEIDLK